MGSRATTGVRATVLAVVTAALGATACAAAPERRAAPETVGTRTAAAARKAAPLVRWFSPASPLNTPVAADAAVEPASDAMVAGLVYAAERKGWAVSAARWTVPVFYANRGTPRRRVRLDAPWRARDWMLRVPIPGVARPDPGGDGHMAVIDTSTGCFFEFFRARRTARGSWQAEWANRGSLGGSGIQPGGMSTRASGFANLAGLIRPRELAAGRIDHALVFGAPFTKAGGPVPPATASDGRPASESGAAVGLARPEGMLPIPEGARLQLDPALDLDALQLKPWQRVVARALQTYGMFLGDTAGTLTVNAVGVQSSPGNAYRQFWGSEPYAYLPTELVRHLRVLRLPPQYRPASSVTASRCAPMR